MHVGVLTNMQDTLLIQHPIPELSRMRVELKFSSPFSYASQTMTNKHHDSNTLYRYDQILSYDLFFPGRLDELWQTVLLAGLLLPDPSQGT